MSVIEGIVLIIGILALLLAIAGAVAFFSLRRLWRWLETQVDDLLGGDSESRSAAQLPHTPGMSSRRPSVLQERSYEQA